MMFGGGVELFAVRVPDKLVGKTLEESDVGALAGVNVIAVQQGDEIHTAPSPKLPLPANAELLLVGTHEQRQRFARAFG
jgi:K+/H+ antiporter YhaU regulatory subunit KhtT